MKSQMLKATNAEEFLLPARTINPSEPISKVIGRLKESNSYEAFIEENDRTAIITLRDILNVKSITTTKVSSIMHYLPRLTLSATVGEAARIMFEYRVRSVPIYNGSKLKGEISCKSIVDLLMETKNAEKVGLLMTSNPKCVSTMDDVAKARRIMLKEKVDQTPILKDNKLAGAITSSSIVFNLIPTADRNVKGDWRGTRFDIPVLDFVGDDYTSNDVKDSLNDVSNNMKRNESNYSVITNYDEVQGIVTYRDFMKLIVEQKVTVNNVPMYIVGLPDDPFEAQATTEKFTRVVSLLRKEYPDMEEARAVIKSGSTKASKSRYEVQIFVKTPRKQFSYEGAGYELPDVFDGISEWSKRKAARSEKNPRRRTRADPGNSEGMV
ncbi:MAG: CBS domain-containing protein [Nitrososphaerales archaeon]